MFSSRAADRISQGGYATPRKAIDGRCGRRAEFPIRGHTDGSAPIPAIRTNAIERTGSTPIQGTSAQVN
jgi:hypothetical protein